mmetsp:Transcript_98024/g.227330  ORF Transcript_98024/g.227330 Transcript_98024/m.227330 type:complete len:170 (-) Transcript_98024:804-1313(-)
MLKGALMRKGHAGSCSLTCTPHVWPRAGGSHILGGVLSCTPREWLHEGSPHTKSLGIAPCNSTQNIMYTVVLALGLVARFSLCIWLRLAGLPEHVHPALAPRGHHAPSASCAPQHAHSKQLRFSSWVFHSGREEHHPCDGLAPNHALLCGAGLGFCQSTCRCDPPPVHL